MSYFIKFQQADNLPYTVDVFKARYLELTGELIQGSPLENVERTHYLVGTPSSGPRQMLTQTEIDILEAEFPTQIEVSTSNYPAGWVTYEPSGV